MKFVYFTKFLQSLDVAALAGFCKEVGLDGVDLAVRPGYPIHPDNAGQELPKAAKLFADQGLVIGLVTAPTNWTDPDKPEVRLVFEACGKAGIAAIKIGYFAYKAPFETVLKDARAKLAGFARLAAGTGVKACYHTHSGNYLGSNAAGLRLLLHDFDPHHVGAFLDTGHTAVGGAPIRLELDMVRSWLSLVAIKDMAWSKTRSGWQHQVVPAGEGIVHWDELALGLKECRFNGTISLHGEYDTKDMAERREKARQELALLKNVIRP
jgi:sugar phosphate isomerase/epimerase